VRVEVDAFNPIAAGHTGSGHPLTTAQRLAALLSDSEFC
jgi:hypothetical protein